MKEPADPMTAISCPFCASVELIMDTVEDEVWWQIYERRGERVQCLDCGARGPLGQDREAAVTKWNTRMIGDGTP